MQKIYHLLLAVICAATFSLISCSGDFDHDDAELSVPIHMEVSTENIQTKVGLSGFVFGTFLMLDAYLIIFLSCMILIVRDQTMKKLNDTVKLIIQMLNPSGAEGSGIERYLGLLAKNEVRVQIGSAGLVIGIVLAYFGAWIAT